MAASRRAWLVLTLMLARPAHAQSPATPEVTAPPSTPAAAQPAEPGAAGPPTIESSNPPPRSPVVTAASAPAVPPRPRRLRLAGNLLLVVGLAVVAASIYPLSVDGQGSCSLTPPAELCPRTYATAPLGAALLASGLAAAAGGAVMSLWARRPQARSLALGPLLPPAGSGLGLALSLAW